MDGQGAPHKPKLRGVSWLREAVNLGHGDELAYHLKCILKF